MTSSRLKTDVVPAVLTGATGVVTLAAILLVRDQLPISRGVARGLGFPLLYAGMALFIWAALHLRGRVGHLVTPRLEQLVVTGPFRFIRHPTYCGLAIAMVGAGIVTRSTLGLALSVVLFLPVEIYRARLEEQALRDKFSEVWQAYAAQTGFLLPRIRRADSLPEDKEQIADGGA